MIISRSLKFNLTDTFKGFYLKYFVPMSVADREKITGYLYILLTLSAVCFFGLVAIGPTLATVSNLDKQYKDDQIVYKALHQKVLNLKSLDAEYSNIQDDLDRIYSAIPKSTQVPKMTRQLENLAAQNNLSMTRLTFNTVEIFPNIKTDPIYSFVFTISVAGEQENVNKFISEVINFDRIIGVDRITTGTDQESKYTVSLTGRAFFATK